MKIINESALDKLTKKLCSRIDRGKYKDLYPIPRGGYPIAIRMSKILSIPIILNKKQITSKTLIVDDLIDSGKTLSEFSSNDKAVVFVKNGKQDSVNFFAQELKSSEWVKFPDEPSDEVLIHLERILQYIGEDTSREGLIETPMRMKKAYDEIFSGYKTNPKDLIKTFTQGTCQEMVILKNCEFYSTCEHHFFPFYGHISIGYIPDKKVIGVSKLARLVDCFSRRMQIQERMTSQIADFLEKELGARGVYVVCEGVHFCMTSRGIKKQDASMITSAIRGVFETNAQSRNEFLNLIK